MKIIIILAFYTVLVAFCFYCIGENVSRCKHIKKPNQQGYINFPPYESVDAQWKAKITWRGLEDPGDMRSEALVEICSEQFRTGPNDVITVELWMLPAGREEELLSKHDFNDYRGECE